ncbi:MAG TPA: phenylalanine--tRNA ligase subunit alpha [Clostridiales bacterium]|nr:phenylalanine--tRNA ligase subunit alpha [Clostridiales bacterium]
MKEKIEQLKMEFDKVIKEHNSMEKIDELRVAYLGKKGKITELMQGLKDVIAEQRRDVGIAINNFKQYVEGLIENKVKEAKELELQKEINNAERIDITIPSGERCGSLHPITVVQKEVEEIFKSMGFVVEDGNEIETEFNNFDAVNVPRNHPARDMQDTFWLDNGEVLKTQTSAGQNRILRKYGAPCKVIFPGRCFRNESVDASHENTFFQLEGMMVGRDINVANLIYFMKTMLSKVLKKDVDVRLRPGFFPFTEPSFELDVTCPFCGGKGCPTCKQGGWIELCPCGMIHPEVLRMGGVDTNKYQGFAFGLGLTRLAMMKYNIKEIRTLNSGNIPFLSQTKIR